MSKSSQKPTILNVEVAAHSRLFITENMDLEFSNGVRCACGQMHPANREAAMIVPTVSNHLILIRKYAVGTESHGLGFLKGLINPGESAFETANRELKEEVRFGASDLTFLKKFSMASSYFSSKMSTVMVQDLYPESLEGDEPRPLPQVYWPLACTVDLLEALDFNEARNVNALFPIREWLERQG